MKGRIISPQVRILAPAWEKLMAYIRACPQEISGLGTVEMRGSALVVTDVHLIGQKVTAATTDLDPEALSRFIIEWAGAGKDQRALRLWWHSHASMGVFWSSTDNDTIRELTENGWLLSIVGNHAGDTKTRLTVCSGGVEIGADDLRLEIVSEVSSAALEAARTEVHQKVVQQSGYLLGLGRRIGRSSGFPGREADDALFSLTGDSRPGGGR